MKTKWMLMGFLLTTGMAMAVTNTPPTPVIVSCTMREGTTLMDITYRVNDPDDAVVSAWPLAFVDGTRSFAKVIRPTTFAEDTQNNFGTNVTVNTDHQLVWNVGADWDIDLGQLKFEIICKDSRGLLPFDWISIPATATTEAITISKNILTSNQVMNAIFYQYALRDEGLILSNSVLYGTSASGILNDVDLVVSNSIKAYAAPYIMKQMNLQPALPDNVSLAIAARSGVSNSVSSWFALNRPYSGISNIVVGIGQNTEGQCTIPVGVIHVKEVSGGGAHSMGLTDTGTLFVWGQKQYYNWGIYFAGVTTTPCG